MSVRDATGSLPNSSVIPQGGPSPTGTGTGTDTGATRGSDEGFDDEGYESDTHAPPKKPVSARSGTGSAVHADEGYGDDAASANNAANPSSPENFWNKEQAFESKRSQQRQKIDATLGKQQVGQQSGDSDSTTGHTAGAVFKAAGIPIPPKGMLAKVHTAVQNNPDFDRLKSFIKATASPTNEKLDPQAVAKQLVTLATTVATTSNLGSSAKLVTTNGAKDAPPAAPAPTPSGSGSAGSDDSYLSGGNAFAIVFLAMNQSLSEDNKIKQVVLKQMQICNKISELIQGYIGTLQQAQAALDKKTSGKDPKTTQNATVPVEAWTNTDVDTLYEDKNGNFTLSHGVDSNKKASATGLSTDLTAANGMQSTAQNNSTQASNRYQAVDTAQTSGFSMLAQVLKSAGEVLTALVNNLKS